MKAINIKWDVDDDESVEDLPAEIEIPKEITDEDKISDYITELTGYCHYGFDLVESEENTQTEDIDNKESR